MAYVAYVIGNGPSKALLDLTRVQGETYACNLFYRQHRVDHLFSVDYLYQLDILADEYPLQGQCYFSNWYPLPKEFPPEHMDIPKEFELVEVNPADKETAVSWTSHFYPRARYNQLCNDDLVQLPSCVRPNVGLIYWVSAGMQVENLESKILPLDARVPPSGAFALEKALQSSADRVEVYGFDAVAGNYTTTSDTYFGNQQKNKDSKRSVSYKAWYDLVVTHYDKEVIWHLPKA